MQNKRTFLIFYEIWTRNLHFTCISLQTAYNGHSVECIHGKNFATLSTHNSNRWKARCILGYIEKM